MLRKHICLSLLTILLTTTADAGKIFTDANVSDIVVTENKQFGFGGWNFDNVEVRIVNVSDFSTAVIGSNFNTLTGTYTPMGLDMSFESDIKGPGGVVFGHLRGKDWPVGEPAGIKVINDDMSVQHGKPVNCIMTSSYLDSGYLDVLPGSQPDPVICSSPFQTHKRFKVNLLPSTVAEVDVEGYGKPVNLVFNLDPDDVSTDVRRYQVLQKINNYTGVRLDGYKIEVLDENAEVNNALTLSLGEGEGDEGANIWAEYEMANMSHGLWGPYDEGRFDNGFFDWIRAYYPVELSEDNKTISYTGNMMGGNYQQIFGNWLPSIWEPMGIFHDDDHDPSTDGILKAFFGVAPDKSELAWWKSSIEYNPETPGIAPVYTWLKATEEDLITWSGEWYSEGAIEDVLNLGLNYIVNIGLNSDIGATFTLRITPHVAVDQTPPSYVCGENQHHQQGTLICIDNTEPVITPPYLPEYNGLIQGTEIVDPEAELTDFNLSLPTCGDASLPTIQGTSADCI